MYIYYKGILIYKWQDKILTIVDIIHYYTVVFGGLRLRVIFAANQDTYTGR